MNSSHLYRGVAVLLIVLVLGAQPAPVQENIDDGAKITVQNQPASAEKQLESLTKDKALSRVPKIKDVTAAEMVPAVETMPVEPEATQVAAELFKQNVMRQREKNLRKQESLAANVPSTLPLGPDNMQRPEATADLDLSPRAIAEYLVITGDFNGFQTAVDDLLRGQILSPTEARVYRDQVSWEVEGLLKKVETAILDERAKQLLSRYNVPRPGDYDDAYPEHQAGAGISPLQRYRLRQRMRQQLELNRMLDSISAQYDGGEQGNAGIPVANEETDSDNDDQMEEVVEMLSDALLDGGLAKQEGGNTAEGSADLPDSPIPRSTATPTVVSASEQESAPRSTSPAAKTESESEE